MKTTIKAKKNLFNQGQCFTKGKEYEVNGSVKTPVGLIEKQTVNDMGQPHIIGSWYREFIIVD